MCDHCILMSSAWSGSILFTIISSCVRTVHHCLLSSPSSLNFWLKHTYAWGCDDIIISTISMVITLRRHVVGIEDIVVIDGVCFWVIFVVPSTAVCRHGGTQKIVHSLSNDVIVTLSIFIKLLVAWYSAALTTFTFFLDFCVFAHCLWKAVVDIPCNLQRVVDRLTVIHDWHSQPATPTYTTTRCREESVSLATFYNAL